MVDLKDNTLIIIEGELTEQAFFSKLISFIAKEKNILFVPYKNNIHNLYKSIEKLDFDTTTIDIITKSFNLSDETKRQLTAQKFVNTYLIFDLDLHDDSSETYTEKIEKVTKLAGLFNDELGEYGKLLINYPMMESYKDFNINDPDTIKNKEISTDLEDLKNYKTTVNKSSNNKHISDYNSNDFKNIALAHLKQANLLVNKNFKKPTKEEYFGLLPKIILNEQENMIILKQKMFVLNTSSFLYAEFFHKFLDSQN